MALVFQSWWLDMLLVLVSLIGYLYYKIKKMYSYFEVRGLPYAKFRWKAFGMAFTKTLSEIQQILYDEFKDAPYSGTFQLTTPSYFIRDPSLVQAILIKDFSYFENRGFNIDEDTNPLDANLFSLTGNKWRTLRHKLTPVFTSGKLKWMFSDIDSCCDRLVELFISELADSPIPDLKVRDLFGRFSTDVIASCAFGIDGESIRDSNSPFRQMAKKIFKPTKLQILKAVIFGFFFPSLAKKLKIKSQPEDITEFFISLTKQGLNERKNSLQRRTDFLQLLLDLKEKESVEYDSKELIQPDSHYHLDGASSKKLILTDELLAAQVFVFFLAGFENTAIVLTYASYFLAKHQDVQDRLRSDLTAQDLVDYNAINRCELLDSIVKETLRCVPPGDVLFRKCNKNYRLGDGYEIEAGSGVTIPVCCLHKDPKYWERPNDFWPDRFANGWNPIPGTYLPFGDGPRICIAMRFAMLQIKQALAKIILNFKLNASDKTVEPLKFKPGFLLEVEGDIWIRLEKIK